MASLNDNTLATANNLGILSQPINISDTFDGFGGDRLAFYRFTLTQNSDVSLSFDGFSLRASIIADVNGNGIVETDEVVNTRFGTTESLFEPLPRGTYFIQLETNASLANPYTFRLAGTPKPGNVFPDPGNSVSQALNLGELEGRRTLSDYVGDLDETDVYRFTLTQSSNVGVVVSGETSTTPVTIFSDSNGNGVFDSSETIAQRPTTSDSFSTLLSAGTYFIQVGRTLSTVTTQYSLSVTQTIDLSGDNRLVGTSGRDVLNGLDGNDEIIGLGNNDRLLGGNDADRLFGGRGSDRLIGGAGNDRLFGEAGNDILKGGNGNDRLDGGAGNDRLDGSKGRDVITTGKGRDRITLRRNGGFDRITDFQNNRDKIDLVKISFGQLSFQQNRNDVLVKLGRSNLLRIEDTNLNAINRADFI
ncbi:MAG: calcium-binding protein [Cyanobacteria bacterium P01_E01_bin.6]